MDLKTDSHVFGTGETNLIVSYVSLSSSNASFMLDLLAILNIDATYIIVYGDEQQNTEYSEYITNLMSSNSFGNVILLGKTSYEGLSTVPTEYYKGKSITSMTRERPIKVNGVSYGVGFSPNYIEKNGGTKSVQYDDFCNRLKRLLNIEIESNFNLDWVHKKSDNLIDVINEYSGYTDIGFDYEGTGLRPFETTFNVLGFSLAVLSSSTSGKATYVELDRKLDVNEIKVLTGFLRTKVPWTYNCKYEMSVTWGQYDELIRLNDSYVLCKMNSSVGSLKMNARRFLGADIWEEEIGFIKDQFVALFSYMKKVNSSSTLAELDNVQNVVRHIENLRTVLSDQEIEIGLSKYPFEWASIPPRIIAEYCCFDSFYTLLLKDKFFETCKYQYQYYIAQSWLSCVMESYGIHWDDKKAAELDNFYTTEACNCLETLIVNYLSPTDEERLAIMQLPSEKNQAYLNGLKAIFNPLSNHPDKQKRFYSAFRTEYVERLAIVNIVCEGILMSDLSKIEPRLINPDDYSETIDRLVAIPSSSDNYDHKKSANQILASLGNIDYHFRRFASEILEFHYRSFNIYGNVDADDESTWNDQFRMLYLLRKFKKVLKSRSTYINGRVGRGIVSEATIGRDIMIPPKRAKSYFETNDSNDTTYVINTSYNENSADTRRWRAGIHTIPAASELREIYVPRYRDSVIVHYDYSQQEVRVLAAMAEDQNLIDAFLADKDIHRYVACFTGDTTVKLLNGKDKTFEELVDNYSDEEFWVYSCDDNDRIVPGKAHSPRVTGEVNQLALVTLDTGDEFTCTIDHLWRTRSGYKKAVDLVEGDSITPLYFKYDRGYEMFYDLESEKFEYTHRRVTEETQPNISFSSMIRHHIDFDKRNNEPNNLRLMTWSDHVILHRDNNPFKWSTKTPEHSARVSKMMTELNADSEFQAMMRPIRAANGRKFLSADGALWNSPEYEDSRRLVIEAGIKVLNSVRNDPEYADAREAKRVNMIKSIHENTEDRKRRSNHAKMLNSSGATTTPASMAAKHITRIFNKLSKNSYDMSVLCNPNKTVYHLIISINTICKDRSMSPDDVMSKYVAGHGLELLKNLYYKYDGEPSKVYYNHKVRSVKIITLESPIKVYDITVDKYHNFALKLKNGDGVFVHNSKVWAKDEDDITPIERRYSKMATFAILYGKTVDGLATDFFHGDIKEAQNLYDYFFNAFPKVSGYINKCHALAKTKGKVPTIFGDYIDVTIGKLNLGAILRASQNFPIQSSASSIAAYGIWMLYETFLKKGINAIPIGFTHDSCDLEVKVSTLFEYLDAMHDVAVTKIRKMFGVPVAIDWELGTDLANMIEFKEISRSNKSRLFEFKGRGTNFDDVVQRLSSHYTVKYKVTDHESEYNSMQELFVARRAFSRYVGVNIPTVKGYMRLTQD